MDLNIALVGLVVGIFVGISGVGGSSLMTPLLIIAIGVKPLIAVGTDLVYSVPTKLLGAWAHKQQQTIDWRVVKNLCIGGIPGAILGVIALSLLYHAIDIKHLNAYLRPAIGIALFVSAAAIITSLFIRSIRVPPLPTYTEGARGKLIAVGFVVGFLVSLTSIGSGSITLPALYMTIPAIGLRKLVGSDVTFAAFLIPIAAAGHMTLGDVDFRLCANLLIGSLPGVYIGTKMCRALPEIVLRPAIAGVLVFAGTRLVA